jgi:hypothetical protein
MTQITDIWSVVEPYLADERLELDDLELSGRGRGFVARGGYYSYSDSDVINTYAGSRGLFGSTNFYRDPFTDRQTSSGPFDHGFFFDSGMGPRGGDSPYPR